ncbi:MAG TPA: DUF364 domain-containing protein [Desulfatiglandales bacterium]|nr:DUF364 domain-containing protein [Desulfatiglandales bacterium]
MGILTAIISTLDLDAEVRDIRQGIFHTGVLTRWCGLAATLPKDALKQTPPMVKEPGRLLEKSAPELVKMSYSETILEAAIGMASINSLIEIDEKRCVELNAGDLIAEKGKNKRIVIIGHFPFINKLRDISRELRVIEKNPREGDLGEDNVESFLSEAEVVGITGTALTNHTMDRLLRLCNPNAYVVVLGDSTPLTPVLFEYGVDAVSGTQVIDSEQALTCVSQGANYRQIKGIRKLTMMKP